MHKSLGKTIPLSSLSVLLLLGSLFLSLAVTPPSPLSPPYLPPSPCCRPAWARPAAGGARAAPHGRWASGPGRLGRWACEPRMGWLRRQQQAGVRKLVACAGAGRPEQKRGRAGLARAAGAGWAQQAANGARGQC
jgi:hypothetical protein